MTESDGFTPDDETPDADAAEQHREAFADDEGGLDPSWLANASERDASEADLIDQATVVPLPDADDDAG